MVNRSREPYLPWEVTNRKDVHSEPWNSDRVVSAFFEPINYHDPTTPVKPLVTIHGGSVYCFFQSEGKFLPIEFANEIRFALNLLASISPGDITFG